MSGWVQRLLRAVEEAGLKAEELDRGESWRVGRATGPWLLFGDFRSDFDRAADAAFAAWLSFPLAHPAVTLAPHTGPSPIAEARAALDFGQPEELVLDGVRAALRVVADAARVPERPPTAPSLARRGSELLGEIEGARRTTKTLPGALAPIPLGVVQSELVEAAHAVRKNAHAPYSHYPVGAAIRTDDGRLFSGANVENASYGLSVCAERSAVVAAVSSGARRITAVAVVTASSPPAAPCGLCRQTLAEFAADDLPVTLANDRGETVRTTLGELLPRAFRGDALT
jgi:cytidine deaminase